jgi:hypothetical protein
MRAFSVKGIAVRSFFGLNARTIANPTGTPGGSSPPAPKTWTVLTTGFETASDQYYQIFWVGNQWLITTTVGTPNRITVLASANGISWTQRVVVVASTGIQFPGAAFGAGVWVVTGMQSGVVPRLLSSPDLITWTARAIGFASGTFLQNPVFGNGVFVLASNGSAYATSPNGTTWTQQNAYVPTEWGQPIFDGTRFIAPVRNPSNVPKLAMSTDGINWTDSTVTLSLTQPFMVGNAGTTQYVVGDASTFAGQSVNGALTAASSVNFNDTATTAWIAFGSGSDWARCNGINSSVQSSPDGLTWVMDNAPATAGVINNMAWNGSEWIAVGGSNASTNFSMTRGA